MCMKFLKYSCISTTFLINNIIILSKQNIKTTEYHFEIATSAFSKSEKFQKHYYLANEMNIVIKFLFNFAYFIPIPEIHSINFH